MIGNRVAGSLGFTRLNIRALLLFRSLYLLGADLARCQIPAHDQRYSQVTVLDRQSALSNLLAGSSQSHDRIAAKTHLAAPTVSVPHVEPGLLASRADAQIDHCVDRPLQTPRCGKFEKAIGRHSTEQWQVPSTLPLRPASLKQWIASLEHAPSRLPNSLAFQHRTYQVGHHRETFRLPSLGGL